MIHDLMITALEGGSNYWLDRNQPGLAGYQNEANYADPDKTWTFVADDGDSHTRNNHELKAAITTMKTLYPLHHRDLINDNMDADTADVWLQCALFGELVYG